MDSYHLHRVENRWKLNLLANWQETNVLYVHIQGYSLERQQAEGWKID